MSHNYLIRRNCLTPPISPHVEVPDALDGHSQDVKGGESTAQLLGAGRDHSRTQCALLQTAIMSSGREPLSGAPLYSAEIDFLDSWQVT